MDEYSEMQLFAIVRKSANPERGGRVAPGRFVMRTKEHLVGVRVRDGLSP